MSNLFTNNSCFPLAGTIQEVFDCITTLIADLATTQADLTAAQLRIAELEALLVDDDGDDDEDEDDDDDDDDDEEEDDEDNDDD